MYIPKVYDGRNKTFWLANYEGWRIRNGTNQFYNVPTTAELNGDFSALSLPAYDVTPGSPCQLALAGNNPCMPVDPNTGAAFAALIQSSRFVKLPNVALGAGIFSAPNCAGCSLGNFHLVTTLPNNTNQQTYKLDQSLGKRVRCSSATRRQIISRQRRHAVAWLRAEHIHGGFDQLGALSHHHTWAQHGEQFSGWLSPRDHDSRCAGDSFLRHLGPRTDGNLHLVARVCSRLSASHLPEFFNLR